MWIFKGRSRFVSQKDRIIDRLKKAKYSKKTGAQYYVDTIESIHDDLGEYIDDLHEGINRQENKND